MKDRVIVKALNAIANELNNSSWGIKNGKIQIVDKRKLEAYKWYVCIKEVIFGGYPDGDTHFFKGKRYYCDKSGLLDPISGFHEDFKTNGENVWDYFRTWTIEDAKAGDILMGNEPFIYNGNVEKFCCGAFCGINTLGNFQIPPISRNWTNRDVCPATKEQCDLLLLKMREAGYEWDSENLKLIKISPILVTDNIDIDKMTEEYRNSLPFDGEMKTYGDALCHAYKQGLYNMLNVIKNK